jgi:hypothetical protein
LQLQNEFPKLANGIFQVLAALFERLNLSDLIADLRMLGICEATYLAVDIVRRRKPTKVLLHSFFGFYVVFFEFVIQLLESLKVLNRDPHLFNFLPGS